MATTNRLFQDFISFTVDTDPGASGTTLSGPGLADLLVVADPDFIALTLDPEEENGDPEIVWVSAHSSSATTATIVREQEGTTKRAHPIGTVVVAGVTADGIDEHDHSQYPLKSIATTKGDLWVATGAGVLVRVGVGTDSQALIADAGETPGVKWAASPRGSLGRAIVTADESPSMPGPTDLTGLSAAVTVGSSRLIQVSCFTTWVNVTSEVCAVLIREGGTTLQTERIQNVTQNSPAYTSVLLTPSSGAHTYKVSVERLSGSGAWQLEASAVQPSYILVEDLGPA